MPVTAKLSREFYERFGDEIANELVEWFNAVDETYQRQLKEVNDLNWARVETRFSAFDERLDAMAERIESTIDTRIQRLRSELILWMFGFWTATVVPLVGLMLALSGVFRE